jgi:predicted esterase
VEGVINDLSKETAATARLVFAGFSQGVAMAFRAACGTRSDPAALMAVGGNVPPELTDTLLTRLPSVLLGRGREDTWYTAEKLHADSERLRRAGVEVDAFEFSGGHEWGAEFSQRASDFLSGLRACS